MKILLLSAYHAYSHKQWCDGLQQHLSNHQFNVLSLPARHFAWRIRGNPLSWVSSEKATLEAGYDLLLVTSMVDLATLRGLVPSLAQTPAISYFHENQFAYPATALQQGQLEAQMVNLYSACSADRLVFNSEYNRRSFFAGVGALLAKLPDTFPASFIENIQQKSEVLPVPIEPLGRVTKPEDEFHLVWNHRWEYDKGPALLLEIMRSLPVELPLRVHILGQQFRTIPEEFKQLQELLRVRNWLGYWGFVKTRSQYQQILAQSHAVLSTALHDFQGLAILEAVSAGCVPLVPDRLAYTEIFAQQYRYGEKNEIKNAATAINNMLNKWLADKKLEVPEVKNYYWQALLVRYQSLFAHVTNP